MSPETVWLLLINADSLRGIAFVFSPSPESETPKVAKGSVIALLVQMSPDLCNISETIYR